MLFYVVVVAGSSGSWDHLADQARRDWYYLIAIIGGFAVRDLRVRTTCPPIMHCACTCCAT
jgi:hypothetical protein